MFLGRIDIDRIRMGVGVWVQVGRARKKARVMGMIKKMSIVDRERRYTSRFFHREFLASEGR